MLPLNKIVCGDVRTLLKVLPFRSIDLVITSPPYWGLRDYGEGTETMWGTWKGKLGLEPTFELYLDHMIDIFKEVKRILKSTGSIYVNLGDTYSGGNSTSEAVPNVGKQTQHHAMPKESIRSKTSIPTKSLMMIPEQFALRMIKDVGLMLRNKIIWNKPNHMPSSVQDRLTNSYEFIFHFTKERKYYYNLDAIRESNITNVNYRKKLRVDKSYNVKESYKNNIPYQGKFVDVKNHESYGSPRARTQRKQDNVPGRNASTYKGFNKRWKERKIDHTAEFFKEKGSGGNTNLPSTSDKGKNPGDVWVINTQPYPEAHCATFPLNICYKPILSSCPSGGIVMDIFGGSGTVAEAVEILNITGKEPEKETVKELRKGNNGNLPRVASRKWIMTEISEEYCKLMEKRLSPYSSPTL